MNSSRLNPVYNGGSGREGDRHRDQLNADSLDSMLSKPELPNGVTHAEFSNSTASLAEQARRRMIVNQCGGLPSPPAVRLTNSQRIFRFLGKRSSRCSR